MIKQDVLRQRAWTETELLEAGFHYYRRHKKLVMARELPHSESPLIIKTGWDTLVIEAGYIICFKPGDMAQKSLYDYPHWPVRLDHFKDTYKQWDEFDRRLTPAEKHLLSLGCTPYYNAVGVWAKKLEDDMLIQSVESQKPVIVPVGAWLCLGAAGSTLGAPWSMNDEEFYSRNDSTPVK